MMADVRHLIDSDESDTEGLVANRAALFKKKIEEAATSCSANDFATALRLYCDAISLDPGNHVLFSNRSAIYCKLKQFDLALADAEKALELKPGWHKAYYRKGYALRFLGKYATAMVAYASGLTADSGNLQIITSFVDCAMESPWKGKLQLTFEQLSMLGFERNASILISLAGQELLSCGCISEGVELLECGLCLPATSLKFQQSVLSALGSGYWKLGDENKGLEFMQRDLATSISLGEGIGMMRAHGNLAKGYAAQGRTKQAIFHYETQSQIALEISDPHSAVCSLSVLGRLHAAVSDFSAAKTVHRKCVSLMEKSPQLFSQLDIARERAQEGIAHMALRNFEGAMEAFNEQLSAAIASGNVVDHVDALINLGNLAQRQSQAELAITHLLTAFSLCRSVSDKRLQFKLCDQLSNAYRTLEVNAELAQTWSQRQLEIALAMNEPALEAKACGNLGLCCLQQGQLDNAFRLHQRQLSLAKSCGHKTELARAFGNLGVTYSALGRLSDSLDMHRAELKFYQENQDKSSEAIASGRIAQCLTDLGRSSEALEYFEAQLTFARNTSDVSNEASASVQLGKFFCQQQLYEKAIPYFERFLMLTQEHNNMSNESKACHLLGYCFRKLNRYPEAVRYYDQELTLSKELKDHCSMAEAYHWLSICHTALNEFDEAMECQKFGLAIAHITNDTAAKLKALNQIGHLLLKRENFDGALKIFHKQLCLSKLYGDKHLESKAFNSLANAFLKMDDHADKALPLFLQQLSLCEQIDDLRGQVAAYASIAEFYVSASPRQNLQLAINFYQKQCDVAKQLGDSLLQAETLGKLGCLFSQLSRHVEAVNVYRQQSQLLQQLITTARGDRAKSSLFGALAKEGCVLMKCKRYREAAGVFECALNVHSEWSQGDDETLVTVAADELPKIYHNVAWASLRVGNVRKAVLFFEKCRQALPHQSSDIDNNQSTDVLQVVRGLAAAYSALGDYNAALSLLSSVDQADHLFDVEVANIARSLHDYDRAFRLGRAAFKAADTSGDLAKQAFALRSLLSTAILTHDVDTAGVFLYDLSRVLDIAQTLAMPFVNESTLFYHYCAALLKLVNRTEVRCYPFVEQGIRLAHALGDVVNAVKLQELLALDYFLDNRIPDAIALLQQSSNSLAVVAGSLRFDGDPLDVLTDVNILYLRITSLLIILFVDNSDSKSALLFSESLICFCETVSLSCDAHKEDYGSFSNKWLVNNLDHLGFSLFCAILIEDFVVAIVVDPSGRSSCKLFSLRFKGLCDYISCAVNKLRDDQLCTSRFSLNYECAGVTSSVIRMLQNRSVPICCDEDYNDQSLFEANLKAAIRGFTEGFLTDRNNREERRDCLIVDHSRLLLPVFLSSPDITGSEVEPRFRFLPALGIERLFVQSSIQSAFTAVVVCDSASVHHSQCLAGVICANFGFQRVSWTNLNAVENFCDRIKDASCIHLEISCTLTSEGFTVGSGPTVSVASLRTPGIFLSARIMTIALTAANWNYMRILDLAVEFLRLRVQCVIVNLWPVVDEQAQTLLFEEFYRCVMAGTSAGEALAKAQEMLRRHSVYNSRRYWMGYVVVGQSAAALFKLNNGQVATALRMLLKTPFACREAFRILLHLVEKSLQRIHSGLTNAMFTTEGSIRNKVGPEVCGWIELLEAVGFRFQVNASECEAESSFDSKVVYFPLGDCNGILHAATVSLHALLSLPQNILVGLSKLSAMRASSLLRDLLETFKSLEATMSTNRDDLGHEAHVSSIVCQVDGVLDLLAATGLEVLDNDLHSIRLKSVRPGATSAILSLIVQALTYIFADTLALRIFHDTEDDCAAHLPSETFRVHAPINDTDDAIDSRSDKPYSNKIKRRSSCRQRPAVFKLAASGYQSEDENSFRNNVNSSCRGYYSEDEASSKRKHSLLRTKSKLDDLNCRLLIDFDRDVMASTARVLSVDERSTPISEVVESFKRLSFPPLRSDLQQVSSASGLASVSKVKTVQDVLGIVCKRSVPKRTPKSRTYIRFNGQQTCFPKSRSDLNTSVCSGCNSSVMTRYNDVNKDRKFSLLNFVPKLDQLSRRSCSNLHGKTDHQARNGCAPYAEVPEKFDANSSDAAKLRCSALPLAD